MTSQVYPKRIGGLISGTVVNSPSEEAALLGKDKPHPFHQFPVHLYHATLPAVVANTVQEEADARAKGYTDEYVPQEFPKYAHQTVNSPEEEKMAAAAGFSIEEGYPKTMGKVEEPVVPESAPEPPPETPAEAAATARRRRV